MPKMTQETIEFLKNNYPKFGPNYCAEKLNMTRKTIINKANRINLYRDKPIYPDGFIKCYNCFQILPEINFGPKARLNPTIQSMCNACKNKLGKKYLKKTKSTYEGRKSYTEKNLLNGCKERATKENVPFDLDIEWVRKELEIPLCPILNIKYEFCNGAMNDNSPSIDRVIPKFGYIKENCHIISWRANRLKTNATLKEIKQIIKYLKGIL